MVYVILLKIFNIEERGLDSPGWKLPALAASMNFACYWLVLWAYQLSQHASYVVAFRQFSIVIGVILAFAIYKEQGLIPRLTGTLVLTFGLVLIGLWGGT